MRNVHMLTLGNYQTNCYILHGDDSKTCCVIDPGYSGDLILEKIEELGLTPEAILLTHGHFDHVGAVRDLAADTQCRVYLCPEDLTMPPAFTAGPLYHTHSYGEGDQLHLAGLDIQVLHTPGHTPGSVCLAVQDTLFSGDTLFCGSCGRTDLPGGSWENMERSLHRLSQLDKNYWVLPGHGESTTLEQEKRHNPYLR